MSDKPNVIFITSHDTGRHFGCYGVKELNTPNIDAMAADGFLMEQMYCSSPVCSPSRGAMMSGMYPQKNGMYGLVHPPANWTYHDDVKHLSKIMQETGYKTTLFFHQHEVMPDRVESRLSFDEYLVRQGSGVKATEVAQTVADYFNNYDDDKPLYAQVGFGLTHTTWTSDDAQPDDSKGVNVPDHLVDNEGTREKLKELQGSVRKLDECVGIIMDGLAKSKHADNTIVIFTVDHGLEVPRAKWTVYDDGIEVAFIIRYPEGGIKGGVRVPQLLSNVDVTPTLLELIGEEVPDYMDGKSFANIFKDPENVPGQEEIFSEFTGDRQPRCIRTKKYKYIRNFEDFRMLVNPIDMMNPKKAVDRTNAERDKSFCPVTELYDLENDPREFENLSGNPDYADVEKELDGKLWKWMEDSGDLLLQSPMQPFAYRESMKSYQEYAGKE